MVAVPRTWATHQIVSAADLNAELRDQLLATAPQKVTTAGDLIVGTGTREITRLGLPSTPSLLQATTSAVSWRSMDQIGETGRIHAKVESESARFSVAAGTPVTINGYDSTGAQALVVDATVRGNPTDLTDLPFGLTATTATDSSPVTTIIRTGAGRISFPLFADKEIGDYIYLYHTGSGESAQWNWTDSKATAQGGNLWSAVGVVVDIVNRGTKTYAMRWNFDKIDSEFNSNQRPQRLHVNSASTDYLFRTVSDNSWVTTNLLIEAGQVWSIFVYRGGVPQQGDTAQQHQELAINIVASVTTIPTDALLTLAAATTGTIGSTTSGVSQNLYIGGSEVGSGSRTAPDQRARSGLSGSRTGSGAFYPYAGRNSSNQLLLGCDKAHNDWRVRVYRIS